MTDLATPAVAADSLPRLARDAAVAGYLAVRAALPAEHVGEAHAMPGHVGAPHLPVDVIAHEAVERYVYRNFEGPAQVVGEEVSRSMWTPVGGLVVTVDPLDGTGPAVDLGFGWSTVVVVHQLARPPRAGRNAWRLVGAAIACSTGDVAWYVKPYHVALSAVDDPATRRVRVRPRRSTGSVATVGAKPAARKRFVDEFGELDRSVYTLGGTPTVWGLLNGCLAASVVSAPSKQWDAVHVLLGSQAGCVVAELDTGLTIDPATVFGWFAAPVFLDGSGAPLVPRCVVAVDGNTVAHVSERFSTKVPFQLAAPAAPTFAAR